MKQNRDFSYSNVRGIKMFSLFPFYFRDFLLLIELIAILHNIINNKLKIFKRRQRFMGACF